LVQRPDEKREARRVERPPAWRIQAPKAAECDDMNIEEPLHMGCRLGGVSRHVGVLPLSQPTICCIQAADDEQQHEKGRPRKQQGSDTTESRPRGAHGEKHPCLHHGAQAACVSRYASSIDDSGIGR
jgi:hypothetical protein